MKAKNKFNIFNYDTHLFPFKQLFEDSFSTADLPQYLNQENKTILLEKCYEVIKSEVFKTMYRSFLQRLEKIAGSKFYYQSTPTLRIQKPGDKAVTFHIDEWSGHGKNIKNFWIPIVDLIPENSLSLIEEQDTSSLIRKFQATSMPLTEFENQCRKKALTMPMKYGEIIQFSNKNLHGATKNTSDKTRLSIDFRIVGVDESMGNKSARTYYTPYGFNLPKQQSAIAIVYCNDDIKHISHVAQRSVISEYCAKCGLDIYIENNELLQVSHYPVLEQHIQSSDMPIVIFSVRCLPKNHTIAVRLLKKMRGFRHEIHFAFEGVVLSHLDDTYLYNILDRENTVA